MLPKQIQQALENTGLPYELENGTRNLKIRLAGKLVGILKRGSNLHSSGRAIQNAAAQIKRAARALSTQPTH